MHMVIARGSGSTRGLFGVLCVAIAIAALSIMSVISVQAFSLEPTGMAKPIADLRDYNGTYDGAFGTGIKSFVGGTLYRDNQDGGALSGCLGEGCGKHPGVDIPVPSGTSVYSAYQGTVVISRCDPSWGGLLVIKSQNVLKPSENVFFVYAHLSNRVFVVGQYVDTGTRIGYSGGNPRTDVCTGNSTGSHLHFQVDKDDGNPEPYYPPANQLNSRDDNYAVTSKTYNPIVFVTGGYRWSFNQSGNRELWDLFNLQSWGVGNGAMWMDGSSDPHIQRGGNFAVTNCGKSKPCSSMLAIDAVLHPQVFLDLSNQCYDGLGKIYFTTSKDPNWDERKTVLYSSRFGAQQVHAWMRYNPAWSGVITGLRVDPSENCGGGFDPTYYGEITIEH